MRGLYSFEIGAYRATILQLSMYQEADGRKERKD